MSNSSKHIAAYVTNHGYGHVNRMVAVLNETEPDFRVTIRCDAELWPAFQERLRRKVEFGHFPCDLGILSPPGQNSRTDWPGTFERLQRRFCEIKAASDAEIEWLRSSSAGVVYADASLIPLKLARQAGLPAFLGANFTWNEIYSDLLSSPEALCFSPNQIAHYQQIINEMANSSADATLLKQWPYTEMSGIGRSFINMGMVVNVGKDVRNELTSELGLNRNCRIVYFYVGRYGVEDLDWKRLNELPENVVIVGFHPPGVSLPGRFFTVSPDRFSGADLLKSVDAAVVKAGYGAVVEAMSVGTPVIYPPRPGFVEFPALDAALRSWDGGYPVTEEAFQSLAIESEIRQAVKKKVEPPPAALDGARRVAHILEQACSRPPESA
ncbi:MAG: hypothetical protein ACKO0V_08040 [bacterium]